MKENKSNYGCYQVITTHYANSFGDTPRDYVYQTSDLEEAKCERDRLIDMADEYNYESVRIVQLVSLHEREDSEDEWDQRDDEVDEFYADGIKKLWNQC